MPDEPRDGDGDGRPPNARDATKLLALAARVEELETRLETLAGVQADVQELAGGLEALARRDREARPAPAWWPAMDDVDRTQRWPELVAWVRDVLAVQFSREASKALAPCWADHPTAVHALTSAWLTWQVAYDRSADAGDAADWQTATLPDLLARAQAELSGCPKRPDQRDHCQGPGTPPRLWAS